MITKTKTALNVTALSRKYKCDVNRIIRLWKKDKSDFEIAQSLSIDMVKLLQVRQEIAYNFEKERQQNLKIAKKNPR